MLSRTDPTWPWPDLIRGLTRPMSNSVTVVEFLFRANGSPRKHLVLARAGVFQLWFVSPWRPTLSSRTSTAPWRSLEGACPPQPCRQYPQLLVFTGIYQTPPWTIAWWPDRADSFKKLPPPQFSIIQLLIIVKVLVHTGLGEKQLGVNLLIDQLDSISFYL